MRGAARPHCAKGRLYRDCLEKYTPFRCVAVTQKGVNLLWGVRQAESIGTAWAGTVTLGLVARELDSVRCAGLAAFPMVPHP